MNLICELSLLQETPGTRRGRNHLVTLTENWEQLQPWRTRTKIWAINLQIPT